MSSKDNFYEIYGPLLFWSFMFIIGAAIRAFALNDFSFWIVIPPEIALWSSGILFTLATSERTYHNVKLNSTYSKNADGKSVSINYDIEIGDDLGFKPKYLYLFLLSVMIWILTLLLNLWIPSYIEKEESNQILLIAAIVVYYLISVSITVIAIQSTMYTLPCC